MLLREHGALVASIARRYAADPDDVEDLRQCIWMRAWEKRLTFGGRGSFQGWLLRLATNVGLSHRRAQARESNLKRQLRWMRDEDRRPWHPLDPSAVVARNETRLAVRDSVRRLPERQRRAVVLRLIEGRSSSAAAAEMDVTPATVRSLLRQGLGQMRASLGSGGKDVEGA